jgi:hypothetical protein
MVLGFGSVISALKSLAKNKKVEPSLCCLFVHFCEAIRFLTIQEFIRPFMDPWFSRVDIIDVSSQKLSVDNQNVINNWANVSDVARRKSFENKLESVESLRKMRIIQSHTRSAWKYLLLTVGLFLIETKDN